MSVSDGTWNRRAWQAWQSKSPEISRLYDVAKTATGAAWRGEIRRAMRWRKKAIKESKRQIHKYTLGRGIDWREMLKQHEKDMQMLRECEIAADAVKMIFAAFTGKDSK